MHNFSDRKNIAITNYIFNNYLGKGGEGDFDDVINADLHFLGKHKLISIWYDLIIKKNGINKLTGHVNRMISAYNSYIRQEQDVKIKEIKKIGKIFDQCNLPYAVRKGIALSSLYEEKTHRSYNDIDLLIERSRLEQYTSILYNQGYIKGIYDHSKKEIINHSRSNLIKYQLSPDHHPHVVKLIDGIPVCIDLAFTSCWYTHEDEKKFSISNVDCEVIDGIRCLARESLYLDTMFHLYRESRFLSSLENRTPFFLSYLDLMLLIKNDSKTSSSDFKEDKSLKEDISLILSNDIDKILDHKVILNDVKGNSELNLFAYMSKSSKSEGKILL
ncbi:nucleotidyltransferase family protein [Serratia fonticola]|uniref:nucleotidyltransferase family protein n=1 Tax=Serratia fonticola TaxID=47917 RepID=UPI00217AFE7F|nr:nucleotidyltransferase family protein [Serratia fonticola]CAI0877779.1 Uncharacterised protein [Serratia fonticola]CAI0911662.1 Uncharacterised protein [Serratia fonticola]